MTMTIRCACGRSFRVKPELAGKRVRCSNADCGKVMVVPHSMKGSSPPPPSDAEAKPRKNQKAERAGKPIAPPTLSIIPAAEKDAKPVETANLENAEGRVHWNRFNVWTTLGLLCLLTCILSPLGIVFLVIGMRRALREELEGLVEVAKRRMARVALRIGAEQRTQVKQLAERFLGRSSESTDAWYGKAAIPAAVLEKARNHFFFGRDEDEEVLAMGVGSGTTAGKAGVVVTDRAFYYRAFETPHQVLGFFTLPEFGSILGTMENGPVFFMLRDGRIGHFRCDGFEGRRVDLIQYLNAVTLLFDPPGSVGVVLPTDRLLPEKETPCQVPQNCAGCYTADATTSKMLSQDLLIAARYMGVAYLTPEVDSATKKAIRIGGWLGGLTGAVVGAVIGTAMGIRWSQELPSLFTMRLPVCENCLDIKPARIHTAGPEGVTVIFSNSTFGTEFAKLNDLPLLGS